MLLVLQQLLIGEVLEKSVHTLSGSIKVRASVERRGYIPGDVVPITVIIENESDQTLQPLVSMYQNQVFICNHLRQSKETCVSGQQPFVGQQVEPMQSVCQLIKVPISKNLVVTLRGVVVLVDYLIHVRVDVQDADLFVNLPIVLTSERVLKWCEQRQHVHYSSLKRQASNNPAIVAVAGVGGRNGASGTIQHAHQTTMQKPRQVANH